MKKIGLDDITQADYDEASSLVVDLLRTGFPKLDLRRGTAIRDLLVGPDSVLAAVSSRQIGEARDSLSLLRLSERDAAGEEVDQDDVNAILSNFNASSASGARASGLIAIKVDRPRAYSVSKGVGFTTNDGLRFETSEEVTASSVQVDGTIPLNEAPSGGYWFTVPAKCSEIGQAGNIGHGTALDADFQMSGFVSASAYGDFSGGASMEPIEKIVARLKPALSMRGLTTRSAVDAVVRDRLAGTDNEVIDVSVCGYGSKSQLRDKHNLFGVAVGGRSDIYVRNFTSAPVVSLTKKVSVSGGVASFDIGRDDIPGMYSVDRVYDADSVSASSYEFDVTWSCDLCGTWHDIDPSVPDETFGTIWRKCSVSVVLGGNDGDRDIRVDVVALPAIRGVQDTVDDDMVRNIGADHVVRCPVVVSVFVDAVARVAPGSTFNADTARSRIVEYINTSGFVGRLTRSEIASIICGLGAKSVDLGEGSHLLRGYGYDAKGRKFLVSGDALDADVVPDWCSMVSRETCVFATNLDSVSVKVVID